MCGIIGYIGEKKADDVIIKGLKYLEYRGYDSSGIAILNDEQITVVKKEGRIACLESELKINPICGNIALGHTRWATHGKPCDNNAHPFVSENMKFAVVHNGIIENYLELKEELMLTGIHFYSQTDSEVVAHLIEFLYKGDIIDAILGAINKLRGSYALGIISVFEPNTIYGVKKDNPLIVGIGEGENLICSDIVSLQRFTDKVTVLDNNQIACVSKDGFAIYDFDGNEIQPNIIEVELHKEETLQFESYMDKEIKEIPDSLNKAIMEYKKTEAFSKIDSEYLNNIKKIYIVGCGTALHAGFVGGKCIRKFMPELSVFCEVASEFKYDDFYIDDNTLTICISQSGETADTLSCIRLVKKRGGRVLSVCNVPTSSIVYESDYTLLTNAGPEVAVASTKAYNCQNLILTLFAIDLALLKGAINKDYYDAIWKDIRKLPDYASDALLTRDKIADLSTHNFRRKSVFYLGRGLDYFTAMEGSLKLKEISYIHSEAYAAGELKHGTLALIEDDVLVVAIITQKELLEKMHGSLCEVKSRGANIITITPFTTSASIIDVSDEIIGLPEINPLIYSIISVIPTQLFSYYIARAKGCDIDKPRNLAKSVTVE